MWIGGNRMNFQEYSNDVVIEKSKIALNLFMEKKFALFIEMLDKDFVWIGDHIPIYLRGIPAFLDSLQYEIKNPPVEVAGEEYNILSHNGHFWIVYGRFDAIAESNIVRLHVTCVWEQKNEDLLLKLVSTTHEKEMTTDIGQSKIFDEENIEIYLLNHQENEKKITLKDINGSTQYISVGNISYIKSTGRYCEISTSTSTSIITSRITLKTFAHFPFFQIHKSYLVNPSYVRQICRYTATLLDGQEIPIGKIWYMDFKNHLESIGKL